jgi:hypothetical protein
MRWVFLALVLAVAICAPQPAVTLPSKRVLRSIAVEVDPPAPAELEESATDHEKLQAFLRSAFSKWLKTAMKKLGKAGVDKAKEQVQACVTAVGQQELGFTLEITSSGKIGVSFTIPFVNPDDMGFSIPDECKALWFFDQIDPAQVVADPNAALAAVGQIGAWTQAKIDEAKEEFVADLGDKMDGCTYSFTIKPVLQVLTTILTGGVPDIGFQALFTATAEVSGLGEVKKCAVFITKDAAAEVKKWGAKVWKKVHGDEFIEKSSSLEKFKTGQWMSRSFTAEELETHGLGDVLRKIRDYFKKKPDELQALLTEDSINSEADEAFSWKPLQEEFDVYDADHNNKLAPQEKAPIQALDEIEVADDATLDDVILAVCTKKDANNKDKCFATLKKDINAGAKYKVEFSMGIQVSTLTPFALHAQASTTCLPFSSCSSVVRDFVERTKAAYTELKDTFNKDWPLIVKAKAIARVAKGLEKDEDQVHLLARVGDESAEASDEIDLVKCGMQLGGGLTFGVGAAFIPVPHLKAGFSCSVSLGDFARYLYQELAAGGAVAALTADTEEFFEDDTPIALPCDALVETSAKQYPTPAGVLSPQ